MPPNPVLAWRNVWYTRGAVASRSDGNRESLTTPMMFIGAPRWDPRPISPLAHAVRHAKRGLAVEERTDECFVDQHDGRRAGLKVGVVEVTAMYDRNAHGRKVHAGRQ